MRLPERTDVPADTDGAIDTRPSGTLVNMYQRGLTAVLGCCLLIAACSGDGDDGDAATTTTEAIETIATDPPVSTEATTTTTTTTVPALVTEGATVVVANASIVGGSAGRMTAELEANGFATGDATNATVDLADSIVHYVVGDADAQAVAESLGLALGGVAVEELPEDPPTEDGEVGGEVLLLLGNNQADRTLDDLANAVSVETNGTTVIVANASGVGGSAGRMTAQLDRAGFTVGEATNATEQRPESIIYYTTTEGAADDADTLSVALGDIDVEAMPDPIPVEGGEL
ncbi:MAG: LytR C-terminal domain-containing protein, partial [Actinomycetota bacterium]